MGSDPGAVGAGGTGMGGSEGPAAEAPVICQTCPTSRQTEAPQSLSEPHSSVEKLLGPLPLLTSLSSPLPPRPKPLPPWPPPPFSLILPPVLAGNIMWQDPQPAYDTYIQTLRRTNTGLATHMQNGWTETQREGRSGALAA